MPETIPADITAAIDIFQMRALRQGALGIGTLSSSDAAKAASEARKRLESAIAMHLLGYAELKASASVIVSGAA